MSGTGFLARLVKAKHQHMCVNKNQRTSVLVNGLGEEVDKRRSLETLVENAALALKSHVLRPLDEAREIALGLNIVANSEVLGLLLEERVLLLLSALLCRRRGGSRSRLGSLRLRRHGTE